MDMVLDGKITQNSNFNYPDWVFLCATSLASSQRRLDRINTFVAEASDLDISLNFDGLAS